MQSTNTELRPPDRIGFDELTRRVRKLAIDVLHSIWKWRWLWALGIAGLIAFNAFFMLAITISPSLPQYAFLVHKREHSLARGDYVSFIWRGQKYFPSGMPFTKIVLGVPGDVVSLVDREVYINGKPIALAKFRSKHGEPLELGPTGVIPPGMYYVHGTHPDSLDSRYAVTGWIRADQVIGRAYPIL
jgi:conjugal transfer pilin signal peptidase TrbI